MSQWKKILQFGMVLCVLLLLLSQISPQSLLDLFARVNLAGVLLGVVVYMVTNVIRALRVTWICDRPVTDTAPLLVPTLASSFGNNVLPARAGEPIFVWAAHRRLNLDWGTSTAVMIIMRVFDTMLVAFIFVCVAVVTGAVTASVTLQAVSVVLAAGVIITALLPWIGPLLVRWLLTIVHWTHTPRLITFVEREGGRAAAAFTQLRAPRIYAGVVASSLVIWLLVFGWIYLLMRSLGIDVTLEQSVLGSTFGILSKAIPFSSIGGWGAHEVGWTAGFMLIGFPSSLAIGSGFAVNTLIILTSAVCGLPAWITLAGDQRREAVMNGARAIDGQFVTTGTDPAVPFAHNSRLPRLCAQICAFNEQENIVPVIKSIPRSIPGVADVRVVIVDDGSRDNTAAVAAQAGADLVVRHNVNKGLARAFQTGIDTCLAHGADIIVNIDADGQYEGADIPALVGPILARKADIVIGDRQVQTLKHFTPYKRLLQRLGSLVVQVASGTTVPDAVSGFRAYTREAALRLFVTSVFSYTVQTAIQAGKLGLAVTSVPIRANETTRPSRLHRGTLHFVSQQATILMRTYVTYEPFKTFIALALPFLLLGIVLLTRLALIAAEQGGQLIGHMQSLIVGTVSIVIGLLLVITGIIADRVRENRRMLEEILYRVREQASQPPAESGARDQVGADE